MRKNSKWLLTLLSAIVFIPLFFDKGLGINVLIYTLVLVGIDTFINKPANKPLWVMRSSMLLLASAYVINQSNASLSMLLVSWVLLLTTHALDKQLNLYVHLINAPFIYLKTISNGIKTFVQLPLLKSLKFKSNKFMIWGLPLLAITIFFGLFVTGSEFVAEASTSLLNKMEKLSIWIVNLFHIQGFVLFIMGLLFSLIYRVEKFPSNQQLRFSGMHKINQPQNDHYKSVLLFLIMINLLLAWVIGLDMKHIWFGFSWHGGLLKGFVHQGTYALILSVFLAVMLLVYLSTLPNMQHNHKLLPHIKRLSYSWIVLNVFMVISVCLRNYWYIHYFGLAYKRIGLFFFLLLCLAFLVIVAFMLFKKLSTSKVYTLFSHATYGLLVGMALFNWDKHIALYNLSHTHQAYLYTPLLLSLDDKVLPLLTLSSKEISHIEQQQAKRFSFAKLHALSHYNYAQNIALRKKMFKQQYEQKHVLSKTWAEYKAYKKLNSQ